MNRFVFSRCLKALDEVILLIRVGDEWACADPFSGSISEGHATSREAVTEHVSGNLGQIPKGKVKVTGDSLLLYAGHFLLQDGYFLLRDGSLLLRGCSLLLRG